MVLKLGEIKRYCRIDYDDDDGVLRLLVKVAVEEFTDLIPGFDEKNLTARQKLLMLCFIKDLYDNRDKYDVQSKNAVVGDKMRQAVRSMLLKEMFG